MKKLLKTSSMMAIVAGVILVSGGVVGIAFTYKNVVQEKIITPSDAAIPDAPVRGPSTLRAQVDIIREHTLKTTGGKTFAQMPRQIPQVGEDGQPVMDAEGNPVMVANTARDIWVTATVLTTALNMAILTYFFSGLLLLFGLISIWTGVILSAQGRRSN